MWFRRDLRVHDNPALFHAAEASREVLAVYIASEKTWSSHHMSLSQKKWIRQNLDLLKKSLQLLNIPLIILKNDFYSDCHQTLASLVKEFKVTSLYYNREYEFDEQRRDRKISHHFGKLGVKIHAFDDQCLVSPDGLLSGKGEPYTVYTPYKKKAYKLMLEGQLLRAPYPIPKKIKSPCKIDGRDLFILPAIQQDISWLKPGEKIAARNLDLFLEGRINKYHEKRDFPAFDMTSRLSPYLAIGVISSTMCFERLLEVTRNHALNEVLDRTGPETWLSELLWRDFYKMICFHFPRVSRGQPFKLNTLKLRWSDNQMHFDAWCKGQTGVPIVDSAMRQLNQTGWMHNRLRMVVAMYLTKNLWLDWRKGEAYFASQLVDWDFSANNGGWQWSASSGNDAAPYFRVFNPILQSERFDPEGKFIRQYCPELSHLKNKAIHYPAERFNGQLSYPAPLVDLKKSRVEAIEAFKQIG
jgi:deoxyribodipyrimidine photo-lyase